MNNKGFTLIELLITILLLAVISVISFVSIYNIIKQSKVNECKALVNNIYSASNEYISDHRYDNTLVVTNNKVSINASTLVNNNYLKGPIYNPFDKSVISNNNIIISITLNSDYTVSSVDITSPNVLKNCTG